ncbi:MAG: hypothetical protein ACAI35_09825 [Candidatus Methylacidiphilales bacterium]
MRIEKWEYNQELLTFSGYGQMYGGRILITFMGEGEDPLKAKTIAFELIAEGQNVPVSPAPLPPPPSASVQRYAATNTTKAGMLSRKTYESSNRNSDPAKLTLWERGISRGTFARGLFLCAMTVGALTAISQGKPFNTITIAGAMGTGFGFVIVGLYPFGKMAELLKLLPVGMAFGLYMFRLRNMGKDWEWVFITCIPFVSLFVTVPCLLTAGKNEPVANDRQRKSEYIILACIALVALCLLLFAFVRKKSTATVAVTNAATHTSANTAQTQVQVQEKVSASEKVRAQNEPQQQSQPSSSASIREDTDTSAEAKLTTIALPYRIKMDVPSAWQVRADGVTQPISPRVQSTKPVEELDLSKGPVVLLEAGVFASDEAVITISIENHAPGMDTFARNVTEEELKKYVQEVIAKMERDANAGITKKKTKIIESVRPENRIVGKYWSIVMSARQKDIDGKQYDLKKIQIFTHGTMLTIDIRELLTKGNYGNTPWNSALSRAENSIRVAQ